MKLKYFIVLIVLVYIFFPTWTPKIKGGISEYRMQEINGEKLQIMIRGKNRNNPIIINVHGGPSVPETPYIRKYQNLLEENFTIVNYDQRGAGKSYRFGADYRFTSQTHVDDIIAMTKYVKEYLNTDKVILMGHSWGTYIGLKAVHQNPSDYSAYIGIGQVTDMKKNEIIAWEKSFNASTNANSQKDIAKLNKNKEAIYGGNALVDRNILRKYGYTARNIDENRDYVEGIFIRFGI